MNEKAQNQDRAKQMQALEKSRNKEVNETDKCLNLRGFVSSNVPKVPY